MKIEMSQKQIELLQRSLRKISEFSVISEDIEEEEIDEEHEETIGIFKKAKEQEN